MKWDMYHDRKAVEVYFHIKEIFKADKNFIFSFSSFLYKFLNICYLDTGRGFSKASKQCRKAYKDYINGIRFKQHETIVEIGILKEKNKVKKAQEHLFQEILEVFHNNPEKNFTAGELIKEIGLDEGYKNRFPHSILEVLEKRGYLIKLEHNKGFKLKTEDHTKAG